MNKIVETLTIVIRPIETERRRTPPSLANLKITTRDVPGDKHIRRMRAGDTGDVSQVSDRVCVGKALDCV
jgi:hypothetical protein